MATQTILVGTSESFTTIRAAVGSVTGSANTYNTITTDIFVKGPNTGGPATYTNESSINFGYLGGGTFCLINIKAYDPSDKPIIDGTGAGTTCFIVNRDYDAGASLSWTNTFENLKFQNWNHGNSNTNGIFRGVGQHGAINVRGCNFVNCNSGSVIYSFGSLGSRIGTLENNLFLNCDQGISLAADSDVRVIVKNNVFSSNNFVNTPYFVTTTGLGAIPGLVYNNSTYIKCNAGTTSLIYAASASNNSVEAIVTGGTVTGISAYSYSNNLSSGSMTYFATLASGPGNGGNNLSASYSPGYADVTTGDLSVSRNSPLFNAGKTISSVTSSYNGVSRPQPTVSRNGILPTYDIGAYEILLSTNASRIMNLPERILLGDKDSKSGEYPTNFRTGDHDFNGKKSTLFDDTKTLIFGDSQVIYPTMLNSSSQFLMNDIQNSDLFLGIESSGSIRAGTSDTHIKFTNEQNISPFVESRIYLDNDNTFYSTGSSSGTLPGFSQKLGTKTIISFDYNTSGSQAIFFATSSNGSVNPKAIGSGSGVSFLNFQTNKWEMLIPNSVDVYSVSGAIRAGSCLAFLPDAGYDISSSFDKVIENIGQPVSDYGFPVAKQYNATGSQCLNLSSILSAPFLLEKIEVTVSGVFGLAPVGTTKPPFIKQFFILNQFTNGDNPIVTGTYEQTLLVTGTEISQTFEKRGSRDLVAYANFAFIRADSTGSYTGQTPLASIWDSNTLINSTNTNVNYGVTGSYTARIVPRIGTNSEGLGEWKVRSGSLALSYGGGGSSLFALLRNPSGGRNLRGSSSGRSFIKSIAGSTTTQTVTLNGSYGDSGKAFIKQNSYSDSQYVLLPTDNLVFGWNNHPKVIGSDAWSDGTNNESSFTRFADEIISCKITLFGSLLRENLPVESITNQPLDTNALHESVEYNAQVYDQFDVDPIEVNSGSYSDNIVSGNILAEPYGDPSAQNVRKVQGSSVGGQSGASGSFQRFVRMTDSIGKIYDSYPPDPIVSIQHVGKGIFDTTGAGNRGYLVAVSPPAGNIFVDAVAYLSGVDSDWYMRPAYELSNVRSTYSSFKDTRATAYDSSNASAGVQQVTNPNTLVIFTDTSRGQDCAITLGCDLFGNIDTDTSRQATTKWLFGFGDESYNVPGVIPFAQLDILTKAQAPSIRGYKYGLAGLFGSSVDARFRRERFGQFRDMLEQRRFAATLNGSAIDYPIFVSFVSQGTGIGTVSPDRTHSQNLSPWSTSSFPYYDGETKDRSDNPDETLTSITVS